MKPNQDRKCLDCGKKLPADYPFTYCDEDWEKRYPSNSIATANQDKHSHTFHRVMEVNGEEHQECECGATHWDSQDELRAALMALRFKSMNRPGVIGDNGKRVDMYALNDVEVGKVVQLINAHTQKAVTEAYAQGYNDRDAEHEKSPFYLSLMQEIEKKSTQPEGKQL